MTQVSETTPIVKWYRSVWCWPCINAWKWRLRAAKGLDQIPYPVGGAVPSVSMPAWAAQHHEKCTCELHQGPDCLRAPVSLCPAAWLSLRRVLDLLARSSGAAVSSHPQQVCGEATSRSSAAGLFYRKVISRLPRLWEPFSFRASKKSFSILLGIVVIQLSFGSVVWGSLAVHLATFLRAAYVSPSLPP